MKEKYESLLWQVRAGLALVRASLRRGWAVARRGWTKASDLSLKAWIWTRKGAQAAWTKAAISARNAPSLSREALKAGWISFRDSWTKADWLAGIKPLPPGMAGKLTAVTMVTGLVLMSLVYGDYYQRKVAEARMIPSGEHPSQMQDPVPPPPAPVPEPVKPEGPAAAPAPAAGPRLPQMGEAFVDRFDGGEIDEGRWFIADGWSNGDWMDNDWRRSQLSLDPTGLTMTMARGPEDSSKPLASGEIHSNPFYRYGYFEVRMRVPRDPGIVAGFFTYAVQEGATRPNEIDIEILGRNTRVLEATIHENGKSTHKAVRLPFDAADDFHTYAFDWQPNAVRWYADGKLIHEEKGPAAARLVRPQQINIDLWASTQLKDWLGPLNVAKAPWKLEIACVAYAPGRSDEPLCR